MAAELVKDGPWAGWKAWHARPEGRFVDGLGDVYYRTRQTDAGGPGFETAIETGRRHANGLGFLHGGFLMAFVDVTMFAAIRHLLDQSAGVTLQCSTDFIGGGHVGRVLEGRGHVVRETGRLVWVAGTLSQDDGAHLVCQWHGILRKVPRSQ